MTAVTNDVVAVRPALSVRVIVPRAAFVVGLALPLILSRAIGEYGNTIVVTVAVGMIAAAGLHVLVHWAGQISIAQVAFMGVGAFVTVQANTIGNMPLTLAVLVGTGGAVVASLAIGLPALRIRGLALAITTLAFNFAAVRWLFLQPWLVPQESGVPLAGHSVLGFDITQAREFVVPVGIVTVLVLGLTARIGASALGRSLRMAAHDEEVAASHGINVSAQKLFAFLYAGGCAGLAGALMVLSIGRLGAAAFPVSRSVVFLSAVLVGGPGPIWGSVQTIALFAIIPTVFVGLGQYVDLLGALGILAVVVLSPAGVNGLALQLEHAITTRLHRHARDRRGGGDS